MQTVVAIILLTIALTLFWAWRTQRITNYTLNAVAAILTVIAGIAAIVLFIVPGASLPPTNLPQPSITPLQTSTAALTATFTPTLLPAITSPLTSMPTMTLVAATCDDFENGIIDKTSWNLRGDETIISEKNGVLNLNVIDQSQNGSAFAAVEANLVEGKRVSEVSYTTTLISYGDNKYGIGGIDFFLEGGQLISLGVGPGSPGLGQIEFSICPTRNSDYDECEHPSLNIPIGAPLTIQAIASNQIMDFYIDNELQQTVPISSSIANIQFYLYGDQGSAFHVTVDDLCIHYSGG